MMLTADNNGTLIGVFDTVEAFRDEFTGSYLKTIKECTFVDNYDAMGCFHNGGDVYLLNENTYPDLNSVQTGAILSDGTLLLIRRYGGCDICEGSFCDNCGWIVADVNGFNGPNTFGKDIFALKITASGYVRACGIPGDNEEGTCNSSNSGWGCAALVLQNIDY